MASIDRKSGTSQIGVLYLAQMPFDPQKRIGDDAQRNPDHREFPIQIGHCQCFLTRD